MSSTRSQSQLCTATPYCLRAVESLEKNKIKYIHEHIYIFYTIIYIYTFTYIYFIHTYMHSQALRIKAICLTTSEFNKSCDIITESVKERGYPKNLLYEEVDKVKNTKRKQALSTNNRTIQNRIPVSISYSRYLPNISNIITKN